MESSLYLSMFKPLLWLLPILILLSILKSPAVKGWFGEKLVEKKAARRLSATTYRPFHNVTIPDGRATTQIDHIYVSPYGIFVLETKNYKGWIFGSERDSLWTQSIYKKKSKFQNPLRQNYKHAKTLAALLDLPDNLFHPVVVFTGNCQFKTAMPKSVRTLANFTDHILSFQAGCLSPEQVRQACSALAAGRLEPSRATNRTHVQGLRERHKKRFGT